MAAAYHLHTSLMYQLTLTSRLQERRLEAGLRRFGLTRVTWCVLLAAQEEGFNQPSEIADFVGIDRTATSRALRQLEARGWIRRDSGTGDRRTTAVHVTGEGTAVIARAMEVAADNQRHFLSKLAPGEAETLHRLLTDLRHGEVRGLLRF